MEKIRTILINLIQGAIFGIANIIPGVSGGTMALIMGFYERLIGAIHNISKETVTSTIGLVRFNSSSRKNFREQFNKIDGWFLILLFLGAIISIVLLAGKMTMLLTNYHDQTYGFFFGLVIVSLVAPYKLISKKTVAVFLAVIISATIVIGISAGVSNDSKIMKAKNRIERAEKKNISSRVSPSITSIKFTTDGTQLFLFFIFGAISISAMILPGVSGSFILLLLGGYFEVLKAITNRDLPLLAVFAIGCLIGLLGFTRLLNYLLAKWHDITMGVLLGLVFGSLWVIWPFKNFTMIGTERVDFNNILPPNFGDGELYTMLATVAGAIIVVIMILIESHNNNVAA